MKKVAVIILNFKTPDLTVKCLTSINNSSYKKLEIILVDNNSQDNIKQQIDRFKDVHFIQNSENLGYTGGNNIGIKKGLELGADLVFILNPDTTVEKDTISNLVKGLEEQSADIVSPKIYFANSKILWYAGKKFDQANVLGLHIGVDEKDIGKYDEDVEQDSVTGAAMLIRREVFQKIGLLDERYFLYYEEDDFCTRAKRAGFKIMYIHSAIVYHRNAQSTGVGTPLQDYFITRNRMLYASKFLSFRTRFALVREVLRNFRIPARRLALFDFIIGNFGKGGFLG